MDLSARRLAARKRGLGGAAFFLLSALAVCLLGTPQEKGTEALAFYREEYAVVCGAGERQGEKQTFSRNALLRGKLMLAGPAHPLPSDFPAPNTRAVRALVGAFLPAQNETMLCAEAAYALCEMELACPMEDGLILTRGALSFAQQEAIRKEAYARYARILPLEEALETARANVPGGQETEHRLGYAVDVLLTGDLALAEANPLCRNATGRWLHENMWRYGFIQRYATGDHGDGACENVHIRYVGRAHAAAMRVMGLGLEEYLGFLHMQGGITLTREGAVWAKIFCVPWDGGDLTLPAPPGAQTEISADNAGFAILTVMAEETK